MLTISRLSVALCICLGPFLLGACEQKGPAQKAGEKVDKTVEQAGKSLEKAGEKVKEATK
jgi:hypothetical protein